jgi:hypothetical protein
MMLFDFREQKWSEVAGFPVAACPNWSSDGQRLYMNKVNVSDPALFRLRLNDHKLEQLVDLKSLKGHPGWGGVWWSGLAPDESPLFLRDRGSQEIYALDWQLP